MVITEWDPVQLNREEGIWESFAQHVELTVISDRARRRSQRRLHHELLWMLLEQAPGKDRSSCGGRPSLHHPVGRLLKVSGDDNPLRFCAWRDYVQCHFPTFDGIKPIPLTSRSTVVDRAARRPK